MPMRPAGTFSPPTGILLQAATVLLALTALAGGWTIPFLFESSSILYKFGLERTCLRSGKIIGITALLLLFYQLLLAWRPLLLRELFPGRQLSLLHRFNGLAIACLLVLHPLLIKGSENFTPYTLEKKYLPEFMGMALLAVLLLLALSALFRNFLRLSSGRWLLLHRCSATAAVILLPLHVLYVSETFRSGLPRTVALVLFCTDFLLLVGIWRRRLSQNKRQKGRES